MGVYYNAAPPTGMCFCFDALNPRCYSRTGTTFRDLVSGATATAVVSGATLGIVNNHLRFVPGANTRNCYIPFLSSSVRVPTGGTGSWSWASYFEDQGDIDHVNIGKETGGSWDGVNGFVFGTGYGTDGPRIGIGGTTYNTWLNGGSSYATNVWQFWTVTYYAGQTNGFKIYLNGALNYQTNSSNVNIGSNSNTLNIGATNNRGGNWGGYMDLVQIWERELSAAEVFQNFQIFRGRFGL